MTRQRSLKNTCLTIVSFYCSWFPIALNKIVFISIKDLITAISYYWIFWILFICLLMGSDSPVTCAECFPTKPAIHTPYLILIQCRLCVWKLIVQLCFRFLISMLVRNLYQRWYNSTDFCALPHVNEYLTCKAVLRALKLPK